jgi:hypothetical protein
MDYVGANFPYFPAFLIRLISSRAENDESRREVQPGLWLEEVPVPEVRGDDVLIRVLKTSICGTDVTA